jgi:hypothetical protein
MAAPQAKSRHPTIPAPVPETKEWFSVDDFSIALKASNIDSLADEQHLINTAHLANRAVSYVLSAKRLPHKRKLAASVKVLTSIETYCRSVIGKLLSEIPLSEHENCSEIDLGRALASSNSVALVGLLSACTNLGDPLSGPQTLAGLLVNVEKLADCAAAAANQLQAGADNTHDYSEQGKRNLPEQFAHCLIASYVGLTKSEPRHSRRSPDRSNENEVSGPLIRYLQSLFKRLPAAIADHPWTADLASDPGWSPKPETIASWIDSYRKIPRQRPTQ